MSYQVLARKYRPREFASLVGQEHVVRALRHALEENRLHHAYLFTGTRGVGKTTLARILAKCLNCETGVTATPCGVCSACTEIDAGRFVDLLEVDAATNTRVDEMRQLLETAQYAPTRARYKVYVIDEVHMLSTSAFNAMLKTLEEPPEHLKFILATTDPQKIPVTVLSRCLQFNLKQMPRPAIVAHLAQLLGIEKVRFDPEALPMIGRAAAGSMRDALSILDQAIAHGAGEVTAASVADMLGSVDETYLLRLVEALLANEAATIASIASEMLERSLSFDAALADLSALLLRVALAQTVPDALEDDLPERARMLELGARLDPETVQLYYQIALQGRADLYLAPDEYAGFMMTLLRMLAFRPEGDTAGEPLVTGAAKRPAPVARTRSSRTEADPPAPARAVSTIAGVDDWPALVAELRIAGAARELARNAVLDSRSEDGFSLKVPKAKSHLATKAYEDKLRTALEEHFGRRVNLKVEVGEANGPSAVSIEAHDRQQRQDKAVKAVHDDQFVQELLDTFDATIIDSTVRATPGERH